MGIKRQRVNFIKDYYEKTAWERQLRVCGIDEVGRGCLAGPLVTAAVILPPKKAVYHLLKDSKELSEANRVKACKWVKKHCFYGIGIVHNRIIDQHNIYQATKIAMKKALIGALSSCPSTVSAILIDAVPLNLADTNYKDIPVHAFPKGEKYSSSIAAASILAKITRDRLMEQFDVIFPGYKLGKHKGYAATEHKAAIIDQGHTIIHRTTFLNNTFAQSNQDEQEQQTIC